MRLTRDKMLGVVFWCAQTAALASAVGAFLADVFAVRPGLPGQFGIAAFVFVWIASQAMAERASEPEA